MERHFTATAYVLHENRVLLHRHRKLEKWLPPGGHIEADETPPIAARREVKEETGLDIHFIEQENLTVSAYNAESIERPFLCLLENIPLFKTRPAHQHIDMIYLATPANESQLDWIPRAFQWFSWNEVLKLESDMFPDTLQVIRFLLQKKPTTVGGAFLSPKSLRPAPSPLGRRKK